MNEEIKSYTIVELLQLFLKKIWLIILLSILFGVSMFCISEFLIPPKYESYTTMYVRSNTQITQSDNVNLNDLNASKSLASTYIAMLKSNSIMQTVSDGLVEKYGIEKISKIFGIKNGNVDIKELADCFLMTTVDQTELLKISITTTDSEISMAACEILASAAPEFLVRVVGAGGVEIVDNAQINSIPVSPDVLKNTLVGMMAGLVFAMMLIIVIDYFDNRIKESEKIEQITSKPVIGEISSISEVKRKDKKKTQNEIDHSARIMLDDDKTPFYIKEAYKTLRTNFIFSVAATKKNVVVVSSANPGEGKSTTTVNIAVSLAQAGKKILLIDADMRKPVQHITFKIKNKNGLSDILADMGKFEDIVQKTSIENLSIITSGAKPPNPSELLSSDSFKEMIEKVKNDYDYIIIDTPPINVVSDAIVIKDYIAGVVLVVRHNFTRYEDMNRAVKQIQLSDTNILGFVLNDIERKYRGGYYKSYYYKKGYGKSYGYGGYDTTEEKDLK